MHRVVSHSVNMGVVETQVGKFLEQEQLQDISSNLWTGLVQGRGQGYKSEGASMENFWPGPLLL